MKKEHANIEENINDLRRELIGLAAHMNASHRVDDGTMLTANKYDTHDMDSRNMEVENELKILKEQILVLQGDINHNKFCLKTSVDDKLCSGDEINNNEAKSHQGDASSSYHLHDDDFDAIVCG